MIRVLSLGAGVQSSCVLLMSCRGVLPKLDHAVFADTQWEPKAVYDHLVWLTAEAAKAGIPVHRVTRSNLRADAIAHAEGNGESRWASMPLFMKNADGSLGLVRRQCTKEYKIEPIEKFIRHEILGLKPRQRAPKKPVVEQWFGIDAPEFPHRGRVSHNPWCVFRYPLVHDVVSPRKTGLFEEGFNREDCLTWVLEHGYPRPPRSACIGCPFHSDAEWLLIRQNSSEWADAVAFDRQLRAGHKTNTGDNAFRAEVYLHRSCVPLDEVQLAGGADDWRVGMANECLGVCGV